MDLERGKQIFFKYNGSHFYIDRECPKEYKKCKIPLEVEKQWTEQIKQDCISKIRKLKGNLKIESINTYIQLSELESSIEILMMVLFELDIDTFSSIMVLEILKQYLHCNINDILKEKIQTTILEVKKTLLDKEITIHDSYRKLNYLKDYDFSKHNIINRINAI